MKGITLTLFIENEELEERLSALEVRCEKLDISLDNILQAVSYKVPNKPFFDVLLSFADLEISDMEENRKMKQFFNKLKIHKKGDRKND